MSKPAYLPNTSVTVDWIVSKLQEGRSQVIQPLNFNVKEIGVGTGFMSDVFRVEFSWPPQIDLPTIVVVKVPSLHHALENMGRLDLFEGAPQPAMEISVREAMNEGLTEGHRNETAVYKLCGESPPLPLPKFYFDQALVRSGPGKQQGVIVMEDVSLQGTAANIVPGLRLEQVRALVRALASLHAWSLKQDNWTRNFEAEEGEDQQTDVFLEMWKMMAMRLRVMRPDYFPQVDKILPLFDRAKITASTESYKEFGVPPVIVHGDLWSPNVFWARRADGSDSDDLAAVIDWGEAKAGSLMEDLARLLVSSCDGELRRKQTKPLLAFYHETLTQLCGGEPPCSFADIEQMYDKALVYAMGFYLYGVPMYVKMPTIVGEPPDEDIVEQLILRAKYIVEDVVGMIECFD